MSKHTPGPWSANENRVYALNINGRNRIFVGVFRGLDDNNCHITSSEDEANVRLIAAAPDLLEALHEMLGYQSLAPAEVIERARQVYRNATGEEP